MASCGYPFLPGLTDAGGHPLSLIGQRLHVFDRLGRWIFSPFWCFARIFFALYSWTFLIGFLSGLACRPTDSLIVRCCGLFFPRDANPGRGIGVVRVVVGAVFVVVSWF